MNRTEKNHAEHPNERTLTITDLSVDGRGVGHLADGGKAIFVPDALPGETVHVQLTESRKRYSLGQVKERLLTSPDRVTPPCPLYGVCGGCNLQHLSYEGQLLAKRQQVVSALQRIGGIADAQEITAPCLASPETFAYRNHAQFMVNGAAFGFFAARSHNVVDGDTCLIQDPEADRIRALVRRYETPGLRQLIVRTGRETGESMVILAVTHLKTAEADLADLLHALAPEVTSLWLNEALPDRTLTGKLWRHVAGHKTITETVNGVRYRISPQAFFQVNSRQTAQLYHLVEDACALTGEENVLDLYCGSGTIGLALAPKARTITGIDIVPASIDDAKFNARQNGFSDKCSYYVGAAETVLPSLSAKAAPFDLVIIDPPRKGCDERLLQTILKLAPERLVYVSCDPATLARDLKILRTAYEVLTVTPVDMFPQTAHVETVVLMSKVKE